MTVTRTSSDALIGMMPTIIADEKHIPINDFLNGPIRYYSKYIFSNRNIVVELNREQDPPFIRISKLKDVNTLHVPILEGSIYAEIMKDLKIYIGWDKKILSIMKDFNIAVFQFEYDSYECYKLEAL